MYAPAKACHCQQEYEADDPKWLADSFWRETSEVGASTFAVILFHTTQVVAAGINVGWQGLYRTRQDAISVVAASTTPNHKNIHHATSTTTTTATFLIHFILSMY
jgi:hypothetical protein